MSKLQHMSEESQVLLDFHQLALEIKGWFQAREIDTGYTDTYIGHFALYVKDRMEKAYEQGVKDTTDKLRNEGV